jgi:hypothetical protein
MVKERIYSHHLKALIPRMSINSTKSKIYNIVFDAVTVHSLSELSKALSSTAKTPGVHVSTYGVRGRFRTLPKSDEKISAAVSPCVTTTVDGRFRDCSGRQGILSTDGCKEIPSTAA